MIARELSRDADALFHSLAFSAAALAVAIASFLRDSAASLAVASGFLVIGGVFLYRPRIGYTLAWAAAIAAAVAGALIAAASADPAAACLIPIGAIAAWSLRGKVFGTDEEPDDEEDEDGRLVSLVFLLKEERYLDRHVLTHLARNAWGDDFITGDEDQSDESRVVLGEAPVFFVRHDEHEFVVNSFSTQYMDEPELTAEAIDDPRLRAAVLKHRAWVAVDLSQPVESPEDLQIAIKKIAALMAEIADDDCLAIFCPRTMQAVPYEPRIAEALREADPLEQVFDPEFPSLDDQQSRAAAAAFAEAQDRWPEFVAAFEARENDSEGSSSDRTSQEFSALVTDLDAGTSHWIEVTALENGFVYGISAGGTGRVPRRWRVREDEIADWQIVSGRRRRGGFLKGSRRRDER